MCGSLGLLFVWGKRWWILRETVRSASQSTALRTLAVDVPVLASSTLMEPGVFGLVRPVLVLPEGITERLEPAHLEAIVAHEMCHVRRRDNLISAVHMLAEVIFWFHPLVWWIGARLVEERERACDEEVLRLGSKPEVYAESILKTCQYYLESPLACRSGISGSDLKERIVRIMTQRLANRLSLGRKLLLAAAAILAVAGPIFFGLLNATQGRAQSQSAAASSLPSFEVASIKPDKDNDMRVMLRIGQGAKFEAKGITIKMLLEEAFNVKDDQLSGAPAWLASDKFDITAKPEDSVGAEIDKLSSDERREKIMQMMQSLLIERCKLEVGHETKELPVYLLVVGKNGSKMKVSDFVPPKTPPSGPPPMQKDGSPPRGGIFMQGRGKLTSTGIAMPMLVNILSRFAGRMVVDKTGLTGRYEFTLQWTPDEGQGPMMPGPKGGPDGGAPPPDASGPSLFTAVQEQLGLKLEAEKAPVDILVIKKVEKPSEN
jgi:uncharacterized protein (TIGR03435 family)